MCATYYKRIIVITVGILIWTNTMGLTCVVLFFQLSVCSTQKLISQIHVIGSFIFLPGKKMHVRIYTLVELVSKTCAVHLG